MIIFYNKLCVYVLLQSTSSESVELQNCQYLVNKQRQRADKEVNACSQEHSQHQMPFHCHSGGVGEGEGGGRLRGAAKRFEHQ